MSADGTGVREARDILRNRGVKVNHAATLELAVRERVRLSVYWLGWTPITTVHCIFCEMEMFSTGEGLRACYGCSGCGFQLQLGALVVMTDEASEALQIMTTPRDGWALRSRVGFYLRRLWRALWGH